jgi:biopolymer transport protein ExbD
MKKRGKENAEVPISSLIDVVFLLIMFFVVTSNIEKEAFDVQINLVKAESMKPVVELPRLRVTINIQLGAKPNEATIMIESIPIINEVQLRNYLTNMKNTHGTDVVVMIRADKDVLFEHESVVIEAIKASGLSQIRIMAELDKKGG